MSSILTLQNLYRERHKELTENNVNIEKLVKEREQTEANYLKAKRTVRQLKALTSALERNNSEYISSLINMIQDSIAFAINRVLPYREYQVSLDYKPYRNSGQLQLFLIDKKGRKLPPKIIEGDMLNQVLSFAAIVHITMQMGYRRVFYDEAFASANIRSLKLINLIISYYSSQGVQFVFVTQNPALYAGLERSMIELVSDGTRVTEVRKTRVEIDPEEFDTIDRITELFDHLTKGE